MINQPAFERSIHGDHQPSCLTVNNLTKKFNNESVLENLSMSIYQGEIHGIIGRNGVGKTTLIESIIGLKEIDAGTVNILGEDIKSSRYEIMEAVGIQPQEANLLPRQSVSETIHLFTSFYKESMDPKELMQMMELDQIESKRVKNLSVGQKQRLLVALAMVGNPALIILDEPTTGIDPQIRQLIWRVLRSMKEKGCSILLSTHYMDEAEKLCDRISILHDKKIIVHGSCHEIITEHREKFTDSLEDVFLHLTGTSLRREVD
ncbi:ABC transporter ATP-binding protein [Paenibacillus sp. JX-17]|uniref:ABC transporter ATP-binding protein n=1 Tax=Paenibacillus lacisoli TaxID=3064525 RepID=A0ABT9CF69_9BACL|nr:ABC transporter ATP-binding protein [Paenibacillus sp. JX-17]MDO7907922.1 ABC transporter ATP-binding protein [Paenibacillus sp. JX-17]